MKNLKYIPHDNHFLSISDTKIEILQKLLTRAQALVKTNQHLQNNYAENNKFLQINIFYENSTRTLTSFEIAGKRLGGQIVNMALAQSSIKKGEDLYDTIMTINAMNPDIIVMRHQDSGAAKFISKHVSASVINAGDGTHEHPTQALLDALTIIEAKGKISGLNIAICGDILHSRVARSNILLLSQLGAQIRLIAPSPLLPNCFKDGTIACYNNIEEGIKNADIIMMLRIQHERMENALIPSLKEYSHYFGLSEQKLQLAKDDAMIMHPGPMNRGIEITDNVADSKRSLIRKQVEFGVAVRMAVIEYLHQNNLALNNGD
ncbi:aspartate carbamoyltransferase catalytic subunit [Bartonella sp. DGB1]|uniref:aspartate carbamoyltransferase catalytic subunit n=1 Tax=Bartonella sp. DGB1 TaxID=3239807 RepID=UPI00352397AF